MREFLEDRLNGSISPKKRLARGVVTGEGPTTIGESPSGHLSVRSLPLLQFCNFVAPQQLTGFLSTEYASMMITVVGAQPVVPPVAILSSTYSFLDWFSNAVLWITCKFFP
jgi:hypothetical protein